MNNVFITIFKKNSLYSIEIFKPKYDDLFKVWEGSNLNDGYSYVMKELIILSKESYNIHFIYKTINNTFLRFNGKKKEIRNKLGDIYNHDLKQLDYMKDERKSKTKEIYQLLWCINKEEQNKINEFFKTLNFRKKSIVPIDYYYSHIYKNLTNELIIIVGYSKIISIYYDNIGEKYFLCLDINIFKDLFYNNSNDNYTKYVNEIIYLINLVLRFHFKETINKLNLISHNSRILKDLRYLVYSIDHNNVVILDE